MRLPLNWFWIPWRKNAQAHDHNMTEILLAQENQQLAFMTGTFEMIPASVTLWLAHSQGGKRTYCTCINLRLHKDLGPVGQACVEHQHYVALSLPCGTHILHAIECTQKISHRIFHPDPQKNHHGILHPQENHHGILSSKAFLTMEYVIHEAVDALAWGSSLSPHSLGIFSEVDPLFFI